VAARSSGCGKGTGVWAFPRAKPKREACNYSRLTKTARAHARRDYVTILDIEFGTGHGLHFVAMYSCGLCYGPMSCEKICSADSLRETEKSSSASPACTCICICAQLDPSLEKSRSFSTNSGQQPGQFPTATNSCVAHEGSGFSDMRTDCCTTRFLRLVRYGICFLS